MERYCGFAGKASRGASHAWSRRLRLQPDYVEAHNNLGTVWYTSGELEKARACFLEALRLRPDHATAHHNLGLIHEARGEQAQAERCFQTALRHKPDFAEAHYSLAGVVKEQLRFDEAQSSLEKALRIKPDHLEAMQMLASVKHLQGNLSEALALLQSAQALEPRGDREVRAALLLPVIYESADELRQQRQHIEEDLARLDSKSLQVSNPVHSNGRGSLFSWPAGPERSPAPGSLAAINAKNACPETAVCRPHCRKPRRVAPDSGRLRVGFLSANFYAHTIGKLNLGLLRELSRKDFHVTLFRFPGPDDPMARAFQASADQVVTLPRKLEAARQQVADQQLDLLYYADIGMDALTYYLAFARLAPVQCVTWGHPVTTGIPTMDYFLSSTHLEASNNAGALHRRAGTVGAP